MDSSGSYGPRSGLETTSGMQTGTSLESCEHADLQQMSSTTLWEVREGRGTSGIHCMQAACAQRPGSVVGFRAPPTTGQRQHWGGRTPTSSSSHVRHIQKSPLPACRGHRHRSEFDC